MEIFLTILFSIAFIIFFIFLVIMPILAFYLGITSESLDEEKYGLEGARYIDGK